MHCILVLLFSLLCNSCAQQPGKADAVLAPKLILKDFTSYWKYTSHELKFSEAFSTYSTAGKPIPKAEFFTLYATGKYMPLRLKAKHGKLVYKIYGVTESNSTTDMLITIKQSGALPITNTNKLANR